MISRTLQVPCATAHLREHVVLRDDGEHVGGTREIQPVSRATSRWLTTVRRRAVVVKSAGGESAGQMRHRSAASRQPRGGRWRHQEMKKTMGF